MRKIVFILFSILAVGCARVARPDGEFVIKVDSVICADTVNYGQKISVRFYGDIGADTACRFSRFIVKTDSLSTEITVVGQNIVRKKSAGDTLRLDGKELVLPAACHDSVCLMVHNPGLARTLRKTIMVKQ